MRRLTKAPFAGSISSIGLRLRGLIALAALTTLALALGASPAFALQTHPYEASFGAGEMEGPGSLALDQSNGNAYVADLAGVRKYSPAGAPSNFSALGASVLPIGGSIGQLAIDSSGGSNGGNLYLVEAFHFVKAFQPSGAPANFTASAPYLAGNSIVGNPSNESFGFLCGTAVDSNGTIYVADYYTGVSIYAPSGEYLTSVGSENTCGLAVDSVGSLYVAGYGGGVSLYEPSSFPVTTTTTYSTPVVVNEGGAAGLAIDSADDNLYVNGGAAITQHDSAANGSAVVGVFGAEQLTEGSSGIAVDRSGGVNEGDVFVTSGVHVDRFGPQVVVPTPTTNAASALTTSGATLNGAVSPDGIELTQCRFEYGTETSYGQSVPCAESNATIGSGTAPVSVHADVTGLAPGDYHFRLVTANGNGATRGQDKGFSVIVAPTITGLTGSLLYPEADYAEARLKARINSGNGATTYRVEYGPTSSYGESTGDRTLLADTKLKDIFTVVSPLEKGVTYHLRIVATNSAGTTNSSDLTLTTLVSAPADGCPNAAIRAAQGSAFLPECRAYEMVSPVEKNGNGVTYTAGLSPDGTVAAYATGGALPGANAMAGTAAYRATRSASDWSAPFNIDPPQVGSAQNNKIYETLAISEDQRRALVFSSKALASGAEERGGNLYVRDLDTDTYHLLASGNRVSDEYSKPTYPAPLNPPWSSIPQGTSDFSRVLFFTKEKLTDDAPDTGGQFVGATYEWTLAGGVKLATYGPTGTPMAGMLAKGHGLSVDGSRLLFRGLDNSGENGIYLRENEKTVQVSASQRTGDDPDAVQAAKYLGGSDDLSAIYFRSTANLTDESNHGPSSGGTIYRYDVEGGTLTDLMAEFGPSPADTQKLEGFHLYLDGGLVTPSGGAIYLGSKARLAPGGIEKSSEPFAPGANVYRFSEDGIELVTTAPAAVAVDFSEYHPSDISPNERYVAYQSFGDETDDISSGPTCEGIDDECQQIYVYDSVEKRMACASCDPTGAPSRGESELGFPRLDREYDRRITNQGMVVFQTPNPLSPRDVNDRVDVYTWQDGQVNLISGGRGSSDAIFGDISADGSEILFTSRQQLVGRDEDNLIDAYVARIDGGLASQLTGISRTAPCEGAECKGPSTGAPTEPGATTPSFSGPGNAKPTKPKARCGKGSKRVTDKRKSRCVKKKSKKGKGTKKKQRDAGAGRGAGR